MKIQGQLLGWQHSTRLSLKNVCPFDSPTAASSKRPAHIFAPNFPHMAPLIVKTISQYLRDYINTTEHFKGPDVTSVGTHRFTSVNLTLQGLQDIPKKIMTKYSQLKWNED